VASGSFLAAKQPLVSQRFSNPTTKDGVPHMDAPYEVLAQMLTVRVHLDDVTDCNGPLRVLAGTHARGKLNGEAISALVATRTPTACLASAGDVLFMRPLLVHRSPRPSQSARRRILHLEFSCMAELEDGFEWHLCHAIK